MTCLRLNGKWETQQGLEELVKSKERVRHHCYTWYRQKEWENFKANAEQNTHSSPVSSHAVGQPGWASLAGLRAAYVTADGPHPALLYLSTVSRWEQEAVNQPHNNRRFMTGEWSAGEHVLEVTCLGSPRTSTRVSWRPYTWPVHWGSSALASRLLAKLPRGDG